MVGRVVDPESGLVYLRARYYDPVTGQFLSRDPAVAITGSAYGYVGDNPLNGTDPSGLICIGHVHILFTGGDCDRTPTESAALHVDALSKAAIKQLRKIDAKLLASLGVGSAETINENFDAALGYFKSARSCAQAIGGDSSEADAAQCATDLQASLRDLLTAGLSATPLAPLAGVIVGTLNKLTDLINGTFNTVVNTLQNAAPASYSTGPPNGCSPPNFA